MELLSIASFLILFSSSLDLGSFLAARASGISSKIVMPSYTISAKINAVRNYGAEILLERLKESGYKFVVKSD